MEGLEKLSVEELISMIKEKNETINSLNQSMTELKEQHQKELTAADEQINNLNNIIGSAKSKTAIDTSVDVPKAPKIPTEPIKYAGKKYRWNRAKFRLPGDISTISAEAASTDENIIKKILEIPGQEILSEVL